METLTDIFSLICGQGRCVVVNGDSLPVCQRCMGLYIGVAITGLWLLASGMWRRGLPNREVFALNLVAVLTAMLGGLQVVDPGPTWRLTCGLWTGHVIMLWLVCGTRQLLSIREGELAGLEWQVPHRVQGVIAVLIMPAVAWAIESSLGFGWTFWTAFVGFGTLCLAITCLMAVYCIAFTEFRSLQRQAHLVPTENLVHK